MAKLTVRNLPGEVHRALRVRATEHGPVPRRRYAPFWKKPSSLRAEYGSVLYRLPWAVEPNSLSGDSGRHERHFGSNSQCSHR